VGRFGLGKAATPRRESRSISAKARTDRKRTVPTFVLVETASARVYLAYCGSALLA
jgi:hypothetical protein